MSYNFALATYDDYVVAVLAGTIPGALRQCSHTEDAADIGAIRREHEPMKKSHEGGKRKTSTRTTEPRVGIFWLVDGTPLIDCTSLTTAEDYGDFLTYPRSHIDVWEQCRLSGKVPAESEYEEFPRGRVMYNAKTQRFTFLADRCILRDKNVVRRIMSELKLPRNTETDTDSHYRCRACPPARWE